MRFAGLLCLALAAGALHASSGALAYSTYLGGDGADADARYPATCTVSDSPSSSQSFPCDDGFIARIDFTGAAPQPSLRVVNFGSLLETPVAPAEIVTLLGAAINLDGTLNSAATPAPAGSIVSLFTIGAGVSGQPDGALATAASNLSPPPVVVVGAELAQVLYAGPSPGSTAVLTQIDIRLPSAVSGQLPVFVLANGYSSQFGATLSVK